MLNEAERENHLLRIEMRKLLEPVVKDVSALQESLDSIGNTIAQQAPTNYAGITNYLDNSLPEWSKDAYATPGTPVYPNSAGDGNLECHNFFRLLVVDEHEDLVKDTAHALKAPKTIEPDEHGSFVANEGANPDIPHWDKVNGTIALGGTAERWDIYCPLPNDLAFPGQTFFFQFEAMLADAEVPLPDDPGDPDDAVQFYVGIYDNTYDATPPEQKRKYIEGDDFEITGEVFGEPNAAETTPAEYQILAETDAGEQVISNVLPIDDAPAEFGQHDHPRIYFAHVAGFMEFKIYRHYKGQYVRQQTIGNTIEGSYFDIGNPPETYETGFPAISTMRPRAYAATANFSPGAGAWVRHGFTIFVPRTYDRSKTDPGMQYIRFGLSKFTAEAGQVLIRRLGLSQGDGTWARSPNDVRSGAHSTPSTTAIGAGSGSGDGGYGVDPPPLPGEGDFHGGCVLTDSLIDLVTEEKVPLMRLGREYLHSGGAVHGRVKSLKVGHVSRIYRVLTESGLEVGCSFDHPFITESTDSFGTAARKLKNRMERGETVYVLTRAGSEVIEDKIVKMDEEFGDFLVGSPYMTGGHIFIANGFLGHNMKPGPGYVS